MPEVNAKDLEAIPEDERCYVSVLVAAKHLNISRHALYERVRRGTIPHKYVYIKQPRIPINKSLLTEKEIVRYNDYKEIKNEEM